MLKFKRHKIHMSLELVVVCINCWRQALKKAEDKNKNKKEKIKDV